MTSTLTKSLSSPAEVARLIERSGVLALDLETTGLNPRRDRIRLLSISDGGQALVMDCFEHPIAPLLPLLVKKILVIHNAAFDLAFLYHAGLKAIPETICTMLLSQLLDGTRKPQGWHGLKSLAHRYLDEPLDKELQTSDWSGPLSPEQFDYARQDSAILVPLFRSLTKALESAKLTQCSDVELRCLPAWVWMTQNGVPFDREQWLTLAGKATAEKQRLELVLEQTAPPRGKPDMFGTTEPWNWNSSDQIKDILTTLGFPVHTSCDAQLAQITHPFAVALRDHRTQAQLLKMYGPKWLESATIENGRVYPGWRQIGTDTGRTSCGNPNMQQFPRGPSYRGCIIAPPGRTLIKCDYSTLQMRIATKFANDKALLAIFHDAGDPHTATAQALLGKQQVTKADRQIAKSANFGLLFGMSAPGLRVYAKTTYGVDFTEDEAAKHRDTFFKTYHGLARWHANVRRGHAKETRGTTGRRRLMSNETPDTERLNSPVQADEADGLKTALALLWERRTTCPGAFPVLAVHDEIVVEAPAEGTEEVKQWLETAMLDAMAPILDPVPAAVESTVCRTWGG